MHVASDEFRNREVIKTNRFCQCRPENVKDIAFIFHARDVDSGKYNIIGKDNVYFIRY